MADGLASKLFWAWWAYLLSLKKHIWRHYAAEQRRRAIYITYPIQALIPADSEMEPHWMRDFDAFEYDFYFPINWRAYWRGAIFSADGCNENLSKLLLN